MTTEHQRNMLEAAAKACGFKKWRVLTSGLFQVSNNENWNEAFAEWTYWNPLSNHSDTAEMCAKLGINSEWELVSDAVICDVNWDDTCTYPTVTAFFSNYANSRLKAWMFAATMVAAKIGGYTE